MTYFAFKLNVLRYNCTCNLCSKTAGYFKHLIALYPVVGKSFVYRLISMIWLA